MSRHKKNADPQTDRTDKNVDKSSTRNVRKYKRKLKLFICVRKDSKY